jgi:hypothetical protein
MDDDNPSIKQFKLGIDTIHQAIWASFFRRGISLFQIGYTVEGLGLEPHDSIIIVATKDNRTESLEFTCQEIMNSVERIDSFAAAKVKVLVRRLSMPTNMDYN